MLPLLSQNTSMPRGVRRLVRRIYAQLQEVSWKLVLILGLAHFVLSYVFLQASGEPDLGSLHVFWYFYATTATTVGYGDLSPATTAGRYVVTLFVMPGGITLFTTIIAKAAQSFADQWRKRMKGHASYAHLSGHVVMLGWSGYRSVRLVDLINQDDPDSREVVLVADLEENPIPGQVQFVRTGVLSDTDALQRAGVPTAALIITFAADDNQTLTAALSAGALNRKAHLVAFFMERSAANILQSHCPNAECVVSLSVENTARASLDPGSSKLVTDMLSPEGQTQYLLHVPEHLPAQRYGTLFTLLKEAHDATLLGVRANGEIILNPSLDFMVVPGSELYFMAASRISPMDVAWPST